MTPVTQRVMNTDQMKHEIDKNMQKLTTLRDEAKVKLHLMTMDAKKEWDETLSPKVFEVEQAAKNISESTSTALKDVVAKVEEFVARIGKHTN